MCLVPAVRVAVRCSRPTGHRPPLGALQAFPSSLPPHDVIRPSDQVDEGPEQRQDQEDEQPARLGPSAEVDPPSSRSSRSGCSSRLSSTSSKTTRIVHKVRGLRPGQPVSHPETAVGHALAVAGRRIRQNVARRIVWRIGRNLAVRAPSFVRAPSSRRSIGRERSRRSAITGGPRGAARRRTRIRPQHPYGSG